MLDQGDVEMQAIHHGNGIHNATIISPFVVKCPEDF